MLKITTNITYKVPEWGYCNCQASMLKPSTSKCRFCVKDGKNFRCALYNEMLDTTQGTLVVKARACVKAGCGFASIVADDPTPAVEPKDLMKLAIDEYRKVYKNLINQGYPEVIADKVARQSLLGGK